MLWAAGESNPNDIWAAATGIYQMVTSASYTQEALGDCVSWPNDAAD